MLGEGLYWLPLTAQPKGIVWYRKSAFASAGYQVPTTWSDLTALTQRMIAEGRTPWCIATNAFPFAGWSITDWLEAIVARTGGAEFYDRWARHEVPFDDETVRRAGKLLDDVLFTPGSVLGGPAEVNRRLATSVIDPMTKDPPACLMTEGVDLINAGQPAGRLRLLRPPTGEPEREAAHVDLGHGGRRARRPARGARARAVLRTSELGASGRQGARGPLHPRSPDADRGRLRRPQCEPAHQRVAGASLPGRSGRVGQRELAVRRVGRHATRRGASLLRRDDRTTWHRARAASTASSPTSTTPGPRPEPTSATRRSPTIHIIPAEASTSSRRSPAGR